MRLSIHVLLPRLALVCLALGVAGCAGGAGWAATFAIVTSLAALFAVGCSESHEPRTDAGSVDAGPPGFDAGEGTWESCCNDGIIDTCFCPAGAACNYGWYTPCSATTCTFGEACPGDDAGFDAGVTDAGSDAGGTWEPCCVDGVIDSCFCPGGAECNYGWYTDCAGTGPVWTRP